VLRGPVAGAALGTALFAVAAGRPPRPRRPDRGRRQLAAATLVSAAAEEMLWRGLGLRLLARAGPVTAVAATSAGFALAHRPRVVTSALPVHAFLAGTLGWVALRRGGLVVAAVAHATYDLLVLLDEAPT
jgi:membrane protease YdiL (CAAX protease family)